jgi:alginate O-acetyltransferase complex protein AlgI
VQRFILGLSKKAILANMTGSLADTIMNGDFTVMSAQAAWLGATAYTLQIYFDFSGYSDMAIGLGSIFGFFFPENFDYPYLSCSVRTFWRRWHMSLSGWFRDYLYIPLGGSRKGNVYLHLLIVFAATGIWHGAACGFLLWGLWHGLFLILERLLTEKWHISVGEGGPVSRVLGWLYTMLVVVLGWVLFGLVSLDSFWEYLKVMFGSNAHNFTAYGLRYYLSNQMSFYLLAAVLACLPWRKILARAKLLIQPAQKNPWILEAADIGKKLCLLLLLVLCFVFIINSTFNPFIYFRF